MSTFRAASRSSSLPSGVADPGALLINLTYDYFPRRVAILAFDQSILFGIVMVICVLASLLGIRRALAIDPTTAMGGGA